MEVLKAIARTKTGTRETRKLRLEGLTPGIIYGHGLENVAFAVDTHDLGLIIQHGELLVKMAIDGKEDNYLIKDVQRDAFDNEIEHVDFTRVSLDETVEVTVPLNFKGTAKGETAGGVLIHGLTEVTILCPVVKIPDEIVVRVNGLDIDESLHVSDIVAEGFEVVTDADAVMVSCRIVAEEPEPEEGEGDEQAEPEIIGKGKEESEESEE